MAIRYQHLDGRHLSEAVGLLDKIVIPKMEQTALVLRAKARE
jgi:hypothetical protein